MTRIRTYLTFAEHPGGADEPERAALAEFERVLFASGGDRYGGKIVKTWGFLLNDPRLALHLLELNNYLVNDMEWARDKRELALMVQLVNKRRRCEYGFMAFYTAGIERFGVSAAEMAALDFYAESQYFTDDERALLAYTDAALDGAVPDELFAAVVERIGENGILGLTVAIAYWAAWALIINAMRPEVTIGPFVDRLGAPRDDA
jgi:alkylhydroperoxidase family enzyme